MARDRNSFREGANLGPTNRDAPRAVLSTGSGSGLDADKLDGQHGSYYLDRAHHTGSQLASTVSDFVTAVGLLNSATATALQTARNFSISGGGITAPTVSFNGTGAVVLVPTLGAITPTSVVASGTVTGSNLSGVNTGDQTISLTGDATGSGTGSFAVTVGKINGTSLAGLATGILKNTTGTGVPSIAVAGDFPTLNQNTLGSAATLTTARSITATGDLSWTVSFDGSGNVSGAATVGPGIITNTKLASMAQATFKMRAAGAGTGDPIDGTATQAKVALAIAASDVSGLAAVATSGSAADLSTGTLPAGRMPALTGDITTSAGAVATTLATVNASPGTFGSATQSLTATVNAKGLITALSAQTVTPAVGSITGFGTGVATALGVNTGSAGAFVVLGGAGGTPSSLTLTNATGLPLGGLVASTSLAIGVGTIELGHATDTTIARSGAGDVSVEGNVIYRAGGTDVAVADGGTGRSTSTTAYGLIAAGTTATGAHQTLAAGATTDLLVGGGASALPAWTTATGTGAPVRAADPTFSGSVNVGAFRNSGTGLVRIENSAGAFPTGYTGAGLELSNNLMQFYDRTGGTYTAGTLSASPVNLQHAGSTKLNTSTGGVTVTGEMKADSVQVLQTPTSAVNTVTHYATMTFNGVVYKVLLHS